MRKFGDGFIDDDEADNSIIDSEKLAIAADQTADPVLAIEKSSTINHVPEVQEAQLDPALVGSAVLPVVIPGPTPVQPMQPLTTAQKPATPNANHNFKPSHRPAPAGTKPRNRYAGHEPFNSLVRADWQRAITDDPYAFDGLLYLPSIAEVPTATRTDFEQAQFTEINNNQRELTYDLPHHVVILDCPDERENFFALDADGEQDGYVDEHLVLRIAATGIPIGSVIEWNEEQADGSAVPRWWYVMKIFAYGTASVGSLYFCVPARNFEGTPGKNHA